MTCVGPAHRYRPLAKEMTMKSIMVHAGTDAAFESRLQAGLDLARRFDGHMSLVLPRPTQDYFAFDMFGGAHFVAEAFEAAEQEREKLCTRIDARLKAEDVPWDWQIFDGTTSDALINAGRLADVLVMSLDAPGAAGTARAWISDVVTASRTPVLAVPAKAAPLSFDRIMVAYDGGFEAANALRAALALLQAASVVRISEIDMVPEQLPITEAATYLSRHGINAEIAVAAKGNQSVEERLLAEANAWAPDLLVMGAYSHGRWRETLFGGVTRFMLGALGIPVLLAH